MACRVETFSTLVFTPPVTATRTANHMQPPGFSATQRKLRNEPKTEQVRYFFSPINPVLTRKLVSSLPDTKSGWARIFKCRGMEV
jgi:hypothetical protein